MLAPIPLSLVDVRTALSLELGGRASHAPWPDHMDELMRRYFTVFRPAARG